MIGPERPGASAVPPAEAVVPVSADASIANVVGQRSHLNRRVDVDRVALNVVLIPEARAQWVKVPSVIKNALSFAFMCRIQWEECPGNAPSIRSCSASRCNC